MSLSQHQPWQGGVGGAWAEGQLSKAGFLGSFGQLQQPAAPTCGILLLGKLNHETGWGQPRSDRLSCRWWPGWIHRRTLPPRVSLRGAVPVGGTPHTPTPAVTMEGRGSGSFPLPHCSVFPVLWGPHTLTQLGTVRQGLPQGWGTRWPSVLCLAPAGGAPYPAQPRCSAHASHPVAR